MTEPTHVPEVDPLRQHSFDGIQEFDNRLPNWWLWSFYLACIFSVIYWLHYHVLGTGDLPFETYRQEVTAFEEAEAARMAKEAVSNDVLTQLAGNGTVVGQGQELFVTYCAACHKPDGGGLIGPNLTDDAWIHGGDPLAILATITNGVPEKGMVAWKTTLGLEDRKKLTAFVLSIKNTNVAGGKSPEGEKSE